MTLQEQIKIMQAFADGKEIEYTDKGRTDWDPSSTPLWNWYDFDYRIKPEPEIKYPIWCKATFDDTLVVKFTSLNTGTVVVAGSNRFSTNTIGITKYTFCAHTDTDFWEQIPKPAPTILLECIVAPSDLS